jgi:hypothetical protein
MSKKTIKNFLITGTPRSCTTWFCKTLNAHDGIWVPEFPNYEPFNPHAIPKITNKLKVSLFDQFAVIDTLKKEAEKKAKKEAKEAKKAERKAKKDAEKAEKKAKK